LYGGAARAPEADGCEGQERVLHSDIVSFLLFQSARRARLKRKAARAKTNFYKYKACGKRYKFAEIKGL